MDWRIETDYDYFDSLSWEGKAWEFLRRHQPYRDSYQAYLDDTREDIFTPPTKHGESTKEWRLRCISEDPEAKPRKQKKVDYYSSIWGLKWQMPPPSTPYSSDINFKNTLPRIDTNVHHHLHKYLSQEGEDFTTTFLKSGMVLIGYDITKPLPKQAKEAALHLNKLQAQFPESRKREISAEKNWKYYLRIMDGYHKGAKPAEIEKAIYPNLDVSLLNQKGKDLIRNAKKACENYRLLLARRQ